MYGIFNNSTQRWLDKTFNSYKEAKKWVIDQRLNEWIYEIRHINN